jgi:hypothetical protein
MLRMSVALVETIGVSLLLAGSPAMAQIAYPVMASQMTGGTRFHGTPGPWEESIRVDIPWKPTVYIPG